jgi:alpha-mannosidase
LIKLIDEQLDIPETTPGYYSFLLDAQTIILEDYLQIRPEREAELRRFIQEGRLFVGPWHVSPDEFLVGPEATVRNLMLAARICTDFGSQLPLGYAPDPFGHIGQLPQILAGVGIDTARLERGLSDEPTELWWEAPDGARVLTIFLRAGYGNFARAPMDEAAQQAFAFNTPLRAVVAPLGQGAYPTARRWWNSRSLASF